MIHTMNIVEAETPNFILQCESTVLLFYKTLNTSSTLSDTVKHSSCGDQKLHHQYMRCSLPNNIRLRVIMSTWNQNQEAIGLLTRFTRQGQRECSGHLRHGWTNDSFFLGGNNAELIMQKEGAESSAMQCSAKQEVAMIALPDDRK